MNKHTILSRLLDQEVKVVVVGCGGTGSQVLTALARLHCAMIARGHPGGLHVLAVDPDPVREANVGRQMFSPSDVGLPKAQVMVQRINAFFGMNWQWDQARFSSGYKLHKIRHVEILISCVDTRKVRAGINAYLEKNGGWDYLLDCGNGEFTGQVILGQNNGTAQPDFDELPHPYRLFPDLIDTTIPEDNTPSCSLLESLHRQSLFINQMVATHAMQLLADLFFNGHLTHHAVFFNLQEHTSNPLPVDPQAWMRIRPELFNQTNQK